MNDEARDVVPIVDLGMCAVAPGVPKRGLGAASMLSGEGLHALPGESMIRALGAASLLLLSGCGDADVATSHAAGPSPLLSMDKDRLFIILAAAGMNAQCGKYYGEPTDPRYSGQAINCARWERNAMDWLRVNGVPEIAPEHLREQAFWTWYQQTRDAQKKCQEAVAIAHPPGTPGGHYAEEFSKCDPYSRAIEVEKLSLEQIGIRRPKEDPGGR